MALRVTSIPYYITRLILILSIISVCIVDVFTLSQLRWVYLICLVICLHRERVSESERETRKGFAICRVTVGASMHTRDLPYCTSGAAGEPGTLPD